ncbi:MAG: hypothetical protein U0625_01885 [Phycisphaerales bacterium]
MESTPPIPPLDALLQRTLRDDATMRLRPGLLEELRAAGHAALAARTAAQAPWYAPLLDRASVLVRAVLLHEEASGLVPGLRAGTGARQRIYEARLPSGARAELDIETELLAIDQVRVRGMVSLPAESAAGASVALRDAAGARIVATVERDGTFAFDCARGSFDLVLGIGDAAIVFEGLEVP